jgi:hypothetical protein
MSRSSTTTQYGTPGRGKAVTDRAATGRACEYPGCTTVLSTYNASPTCWLHTQPNLKHPLATA